MTFVPDDELVVREMLHGRLWMDFPERVVSDVDGVLATLMLPGAPLREHRHPFGPHPWGRVGAWEGPTVLKLRRDGDWYSVWKFFDGATFRYWYVNFEEPVVRRADGVDVNDLQLDLVVEPDGAWRWKDVEHLAPALASGRLSDAELRAVLAAAADVVDLLERDERWWSPWDAWVVEDAPERRAAGDERSG